MINIKIIMCCFVLSLCLFLSPCPAMAQEIPVDEGKAPAEETGSFFPLLGDEARALGYELPKPYGISISYMFMEQDILINSIGVSLAGRDLGDILEINADDADIRTDNITLRGDVWVLPFLNLYGILGHTKGKSDAVLDGVLDLGILGTYPFEDVPFTLEYEGLTYGGGITVVGGTGNWFAMVDANYTWTMLNIIDGDVDSLVISPRIGYQTKVKKKPVRFWVGGMYQDIKQVLTGRIGDITDVDDMVSNPVVAQMIKNGEFHVEQEMKDSWHFITGFQAGLTDSFDCLLEIGFRKKTTILFSIGYRI